MDVSGTVTQDFQPVRQAFAEVVSHQPGTGAALAVWHDGDWVVDLWGGAADIAATRPWERDSTVMVYSATKPFAALCVLLLVDRGLVDLDAPIQRYWPEFRASGDVRQLLSHQVGVVALDEPADTSLFYDWNAMCDRLASQAPAWEGGQHRGESALFYGHMLGEIVRRVDGRPIGAFLREEITEPLGIDFAVGLSEADQSRAVDLSGLHQGFLLEIEEGHGDLFIPALSNPPGALDAAVVNGAEWRAAEIPAVNGFGTARGLAGLYVAMLEGRLLSADLQREALRVHASGFDAVVGPDCSWGLGFGVDEDGFGMGGIGGSSAGASTVGGYAIAFVTGSMGDHQRADTLETVVRECLGLPPL